MADPSEAQLRLVYSLLKPMVRMAARFGIPVRTLGELVRLGYFEHLRRERGLSHAAIAGRMGQTERSMRSLEQRLRSDFFAAESEVGLLRSVEDALAEAPRDAAALTAHLDAWDAAQVRDAVAHLLAEGRIARDAQDGTLHAAKRYVTLTSDAFHQRVDALNHHLDGLHRAVVHRLLFDERAHTMIKTVSFDARPSALAAFAQRLTARLRDDIAELEHESHDGDTERYTLGVHLAPRASDDADG